jgi:predicted lipoprotein with Yx(FWY)xxD motif
MSTRLIRARGRRGRRSTATLVAGAVVVAMLAVAAVAIAKSFTLNVAKNATVTNMSTMVTKHENIAVNGKGFAVYWLTGDSKSHPKCTKGNGCFSFWPPVTAASAKALSKAPGISGKLTSWKRNGFTQAVLGGHPLYTFAPDTKKHDATGEGIVGFGGTWHALTVSSGHSTTQAGQQSNPNPMPNPYPQGY